MSDKIVNNATPPSAPYIVKGIPRWVTVKNVLYCFWNNLTDNEDENKYIIRAARKKYRSYRKVKFPDTPLMLFVSGKLKHPKQ